MCLQDVEPYMVPLTTLKEKSEYIFVVLGLPMYELKNRCYFWKE